MFVAIVGCGHGEIDRIYQVVGKIEEKRGIKVSLVLCCGDFQSVRNMTDLRCMACPIKYQEMHDFYRYYGGEKTAPIPTVFIGGNHEASNYLQELPYGGWVAPNIYFLNTGIIRFGPLRIGGVSGIFKGHDYLKGRHECPPYDQGTMRSVYHYRNLDTFRLKQVKTHLDIMLSHDWPKSIHTYGDTLTLLRKKPFFRDEIDNDNLGSRPLSELLHHLQPSYWFSAHLHVKFSAVVPHDPGTSKRPPPVDNVKSIPHVTKFLALDKILPRREFLQVIEFPDVEKWTEEPKFYYDPEWLAILKSTNHLISVKPNTCYMPGPSGGGQSRFDYTPTDDEIEQVCLSLDRKLEIPCNFIQTAPCFEPGERPVTAYPIENSQTTEFCEKLSISDPLRLLPAYANGLGNSGRQADRTSDEGFEYHDSHPGMEEALGSRTAESTSFTRASFNPDEIALEDDEEDAEDGGGNPSNVSPLAFPAGGLPQRKKLTLPPPRSEELEATDRNGSGTEGAKELEFVQFLGGGSASGGSGTVDEETPFFVLDTIGEPVSKKTRRNAALYQDENESDSN